MVDGRRFAGLESVADAVEYMYAVRDPEAHGAPVLPHKCEVLSAVLDSWLVDSTACCGRVVQARSAGREAEPDFFVAGRQHRQGGGCHPA